MIERDLYVEQYALPVRIDIPQGTNVQQIKFNFRDIVPDGTPRIYLKKPSGTEIYNNASDYDWDAVPPYVVFDTTTQMTAEPGQLPGQVRVTSGDDILNSFPMTINIVASPESDSAIESKDEFTALDQALADVQPSIDELNSTNSAAKQAESARVAAEQGRVTAEKARVTAEAGRVSAEQGRVNAENGRVAAESTRVTEFDEIKEEFEGAEITATASTGAPGSDVIVATTGTGLNKNFAFTIPKGDKGDQGDPGQVATKDAAGIVIPGIGIDVSSNGTINIAHDPSFMFGVNTPNAWGVQTSDGLDVNINGVYVKTDDTLVFKDGKLSVNQVLANFIGTGRTYYTSDDPMTATVDMFSNQIIAPCTIINPTTGVFVVDDGK